MDINPFHPFNDLLVEDTPQSQEEVTNIIVDSLRKFIDEMIKRGTVKKYVKSKKERIRYPTKGGGHRVVVDAIVRKGSDKTNLFPKVIYDFRREKLTVSLTRGGLQNDQRKFLAKEELNTATIQEAYILGLLWKLFKRYPR